MLACTIISLVLFCIYTYDEVDPHATVLLKRLNCSTADCERHYSNHRVWWLSCKSASALPACQSHITWTLVHSNNTRIQPHKTTVISHIYNPLKADYIWQWQTWLDYIDYICSSAWCLVESTHWKAGFSSIAMFLLVTSTIYSYGWDVAIWPLSRVHLHC